MLVADIMVTDVKTARVDTPISEIATQMCLNGFSGMPVVDDDRKIVGIISEKDILHHMFPDVGELLANGTPPDYEAMENDYHGVIGLKAADLMTRDVATVEPRIPVLKAAAMMWLRQFRRIPVAENGRLVGIISMGDVHKSIFQANLTGNLKDVHSINSATPGRG